MEDEEEKKPKKILIAIGGDILDVFSLRILSRVEEYDDVKERMKFGIVINPGQSEMMMPIYDHYIWFNSYEQRERELSEFIDKLEVMNVRVI